MRRYFPLAILIVSLATGAVAAEDSGSHLLGAQAVLVSLPSKSKTDPNQNAGKTPSDTIEVGENEWPSPPPRSAALVAGINKLSADIASFGQHPAGYTDAGAQWEALFERWYTLTHPADGKPVSMPELGLGDLLAVLPPPSSWVQISALLRQHHPIAPGSEPSRSQLAALTFADQLAGDTPELHKRVTQFEAAAKKNEEGYRGEMLNQAMQAVERVIAARDGDDPEARFLAKLQASTLADKYRPLRVPDLVTIAGEERARILLQQALTQSKKQLDIPVGDATRALAGKLALQNIDALQVAQWNLVRGLDCAPLYEALSKRFGANGSSGPGVMSLVLGIMGVGQGNSANSYLEQRGRDEAKVYYFAALVAHSRNADAERQAQDFGSEISDYQLRPVFDALEQAGYDKQVYAFLDDFLSRHPNSELWQRYFELAARTGQQDAMLVHVRASLSAPEGRAYASSLRTHLINALLAADKLDEAVSEIQSLIGDASALAITRSEYGLKLAELGRLYDKPLWIEQGLTIDKQTATEVTSSPPSDIPVDDSREKSRLLLLRRLGRYADAESMLAKSLVAQGVWSHGDWGGSNAAATLTELAGVYHEAGREADVLVLLDRSVDWGAADIASIFTLQDVRKIPLGYYAASALHHAGKDERALPLLEAVIEKFGGFDPAYAMYTQIRGTAAVPYLDGVYARDQFEERPLIWKASQLRQAKRLDEAEHTVRTAIAVDPSDGEESPGDRMRAYSVLADILQARGAVDEATTYRNAVQSIRESEQADEFRLAGLHTHAIAMYTKALDRFADAYCIQSRLAVELNTRGDSLLAQHHYQRAYELMPSSFGRMESHCLGCENVFGGATAQGIAEKVFGDLAKTMPANPQVHYLLGYLREEQQRYAEALSQYRVAASLDVEYLNAWKRQYEMGDKIDIPANESDRVALRLFELDPQRRHTYVDTDKVTDWPALYAIAAKLHAQRPKPRTALYALTQSKTRVDAAAAAQSAEQRRFMQHWSSYGSSHVRDDSLAPAGGVIARTELMQALGALMRSDGSWL